LIPLCTFSFSRVSYFAHHIVMLTTPCGND
jgi:hypothetical protein